MERYEMAELLSKKANVSLEEARAALAENEWDMLDAMVALERKRRNAVEPVTVDSGAAGAGYSTPQPVKNTPEPKREPVLTNGFKQIWHYIKRLGHILAETEFTVIRKEKTVLSVPSLVLVILLLCCFWFTLPVLVIGLFFGCQYRFDGKRAADAANRAMEKVESVVDSVKDALDGDDR